MATNGLIQEAKTQGLPPVDVAVIGAGIAGLAAAVYARRAGLSVRVLERHTTPGGLCTAWKRSGYVFDYCIDYFVGSGKDQGYYKLWKDLGVIDDISFRHIDSFGRYVDTEGCVFNLYTDYQQLQDHMLEIAPEDSAMIRELCRAMAKIKRFLLTRLSFSLRDLPKALFSLSTLLVMKKWSGVTAEEWCGKFRSPLLREAIPALVGGTIPMAGPILVFGMMKNGGAAYPVGGSFPLVQCVERKAKSLGAEFRYGHGAKRIVLENNRAVAIELDDGSIQKARHIVAACDARTVFRKLFQEQIRDETYEGMFKGRILHRSIVQVSLGVRRDPAWRMDDMPDTINLPAAEAFSVDGRKQTRLAVRHFAHDPGMAPEGGVAMVVRFESDYDYWKSLRAEPGTYKAEKSRVLSDTLIALEKHFPGIGSRVEASDVATPVSCERYTGNWRGSTQGWVLTSELMKKLFKGETLPKSFPQVDGFHLAGQWTEPGGGLPPSARSARDAIRSIIKSEGGRNYS